MSEIPRTSVPKIWPASREPGFHKVFELTLDDHLAIQHTTRQLLPLRPSVLAISFIALFVALITSYDSWRSGNVVRFALVVVATVALCALATVVLIKPARALLRAMYRRGLVKNGGAGVPVEAWVDQEGIRFTANGQTLSCPWPSLRAIEEENGTFYFWMSKTWAHVWPDRIFASAEERQHFRDYILKWSGRPIASPPVLARLGAGGRANLPD
ncbi:YcxB family protein [Rhizobium sp. NXC24]|uniref:YcxB family protein n=1 Tax=Rhizobium sp. NXC24 TaxID=2048897 RepID=UPI000CF29ACE|nr:YcxB family protein [Rhizobium sp. NXC24]